MANKTNYTIDRRTWLRGDDEDSYLLRPTDRMMCCLGQMLQEAGVDRRRLKGQSQPDDVAKCQFNSLLRRLLVEPSRVRGFKSTDFAFEAMRINDDPHINNEQRERQLTDLFAAKGIELHFIN